MNRVPPELLTSLQRCSKGSDLGAFLSFGHDLDGFTLGLGSGKVVAELVKNLLSTCLALGCRSRIYSKEAWDVRLSGVENTRKPSTGGFYASQ